MVARGLRVLAALLVASVVVFYFTVLHYEDRLSFFQTRLASAERRISAPLESEPNDETIIIYNRVPKTGSTTFMGVAYDLCARHGFSVIHLNTSKNAHVMSLVDQMELVTNMTSWKGRLPALYHGHIAFIDFASLGLARRPIYLNVIRKPMDRLISHYYFLRYGDDFRPHMVRSRAGNTESFDDCVRLNHPDCNPNLMWMQVPFFCGMMAFCWEPGSRAALEHAKYNLVHNYLLVGVTERFNEFISVLEAVLPRYFSGAMRALERGDKSHLRRTQKKKEPSVLTKEVIQSSEVWQVEDEFYAFVKRQFIFVRQKTMSSVGGRLVPLQRAYHYEKIRPK